MFPVTEEPVTECLLYPQWRRTGENTPFAEQSKEKERDNGHDSGFLAKVNGRPHAQLRLVKLTRLSR